jgi:sugar O-acyltransferase (sialic acid O-acetyltransferase NeuD family)
MLNNFKKKLICWGASDQCLVVKSIIEQYGIKYDVLIDDTHLKESPLKNIDILYGKPSFEKWLVGRNLSEIGFIIAIGNPYGFIRCFLHDYLVSKGLTAVNVCDKSSLSLLDDKLKIGSGVQIMKGVIVNNNVKIGKQCILNTRSLIEHDNILGDGVEIGPAASTCGRVEIGSYSWVGAGATILPRVSIGKNAIVGGGALVNTDIEDGVVVAGIPAKFLKINPHKAELHNG